MTKKIWRVGWHKDNVWLYKMVTTKEEMLSLVDKKTETYSRVSVKAFTQITLGEENDDEQER